MKKYLPLLLFIAIIFVFPVVADAQTAKDIFGEIKPPPEINAGTDGATAISTLIQRVIQLMYTVGVVGFLFVLLWSALQMILNAGDKEAVGTARKKITTAIIGLTLLALAFPILKVLEEIIGIKFFF